MTQFVRRPRLKRMFYADDPLHGIASGVLDIAPKHVDTASGIKVAQYSATVVGTSIAYDPAGNCDGNFMSYRFQPNNNCYNYATNVITNSFAQPGRKTQTNYHPVSIAVDEKGILPATHNGSPTGPSIVVGAVSDGLINFGPGIAEPVEKVLIKASALREQPLPALFSRLRDKSCKGVSHLVALLISEADPTKGWSGDFHWVRCDNLDTFTWSQKDGPDQITNFDFAGRLIDLNNPPHLANWVCNNGPIAPTPGEPSPIKSNDDIVSVYKFYSYMWVPSSGIDII